MRNVRLTIWICYFGVLFGSIFTFEVYRQEQKRFLEYTARSPGVVKTFSSSRDFQIPCKENAGYYDIEFAVPNGKWTLSTRCYPESRFKIGENVDVLYKPGRPDYAMPDIREERYGWTRVLFYTVLLFVFGIVLLRKGAQIANFLNSLRPF